jgi:hypothetical protein
VTALRARIGLGTHPELLAGIIRAVDAIAARCDELSDQLSQLQEMLDDASGILGEEVTRLRAVVERNEHEPASESSTTMQ